MAGSGLAGDAMIGDELARRGVATVLDMRRHQRTRGPRRPGGTVRATGSAAPLAEQVTAVVELGTVAVLVTADGTAWVLDEGAASDILYVGEGEPSVAQAATIAATLEALDGAAAPAPRKQQRARLKPAPADSPEPADSHEPDAAAELPAVEPEQEEPADEAGE